MPNLTDTNQHSGTVTAFFDTREAANKAVDGLVAAGISRDKVSVTSETGGAQSAKAEYDKGFWESLKTCLCLKKTATRMQKVCVAGAPSFQFARPKRITIARSKSSTPRVL